jgi:tetratricopeptide (TPR) repeat protein
MFRTLALTLALASACVSGACLAADLSREQALDAIGRPEAAARLAGIERLAEIGAMGDVDRLLGRLGDGDPRVRAAATAAIWQIWSRSGDAAIDARFARGVAQMQAGALEDALATFDDIVARKPAFAEGWNKRATIYFLLGRNEESLRDCDEVLKRNRHHFGALSGAGQIHLKLGHPKLALDFFRRALAVNPSLEGLDDVIPMLEQYLRDQERHTT